MSKKFKDDYGVYVCSHVFQRESPVLESVRDPDGFWQFFCGQDHDMDVEEPHLIGVGHLTSSDSTIHELTNLKPGQYAERSTFSESWVFGDLEE